MSSTIYEGYERFVGKCSNLNEASSSRVNVQTPHIQPARAAQGNYVGLPPVSPVRRWRSRFRAEILGRMDPGKRPFVSHARQILRSYIAPQNSSRVAATKIQSHKEPVSFLAFHQSSCVATASMHPSARSIQTYCQGLVWSDVSGFNARALSSLILSQYCSCGCTLRRTLNPKV